MDQSYSESDVSISPSKIFERLQMLRQLQIMQRGKLHKHRSQYEDSPEITSSVTEIVSHFSNSTSYNTFRSLLQSSQEIHSEHNSHLDTDFSPRKNIDQDYIEGVSALNLSEESQFITDSPVSNGSIAIKVSGLISANSNDIDTITKECKTLPNDVKQVQSIAIANNKISLDEMPILTPKKNFEELVKEKLKTEKTEKILKNKSSENNNQISSNTKKPFLKRGEGMTRFGLQKNDLVIQNTKALPWRKINIKAAKPVKHKDSSSKDPMEKTNKKKNPVNIEIITTKPKPITVEAHIVACNSINTKSQSVVAEPKRDDSIHNCSSSLPESNIIKPSSFDRPINNTKSTFKIQGFSNEKHPLKSTKDKTWASVLTKEQDIFLRQLKQSDYYKNFVSPVKSNISNTSCNDTLINLQQDKERAEQKMFELLENKVTHESFNLNSSFFNRVFKNNNLECSGESTPLVMQKCLYNNPDLLHLYPEELERNKNQNISCFYGDSGSDLAEGSETCSSVSTCCSCKKGDQSKTNQINYQDNDEVKNKNAEARNHEGKEKKKLQENEICSGDSVRKDNYVNADMAEMNAKLIATSELLKDRLRELEDEIETFRKENANLTKLREELDVERQKFYEEKTIIEQKYNEEKILSEYYLAEEKEKLNKQKQMYDRYVREIRGRLGKKEKDEVINLKKEITELKEEIRNKDMKSTSTIARLRNQIKITEKEKKTLHDDIEKLKKENKRIQHSNDITRRLTNLKYLEQINKKLACMSSKDVRSESDVGSNQKYKAFEIERQSKSKKFQPPSCPRRRARSVPNLNVTSRYAKYFSLKDCVSDKEANNLKNDSLISNIESDTEENNENKDFNDSDLINRIDCEEDNNLEKIYNERFQSFSPSSSNDENVTMNLRHIDKYNGNDNFFIQKPSSLNRSSGSKQSSLRSSKSPVNTTNPLEGFNVVNREDKKDINTRPKSPVSILSNRIPGRERSAALINTVVRSDKNIFPSPEPSSSKSSLSKTNLNPIEIRKPDGSKELKFPNGNVKYMSADGKYTKFVYYNGDVKENFYDEGRIKYFYAETHTNHTTHADGLEVLEFSDGQVEKRYKDGSSEIRLPNGSVRYFDPKNEYVREEWRFPDGTTLTVSATGEQRISFSNGQVEVHAKDHKRREFPDGTVKLVYSDGTSETRYASGRVRIKDKHGNLIMDSALG